MKIKFWFFALLGLVSCSAREYNPDGTYKKKLNIAKYVTYDWTMSKDDVKRFMGQIDPVTTTDDILVYGSTENELYVSYRFESDESLYSCAILAPDKYDFDIGSIISDLKTLGEFEGKTVYSCLPKNTIAFEDSLTISDQKYLSCVLAPANSDFDAPTVAYFKEFYVHETQSTKFTVRWWVVSEYDLKKLSLRLNRKGESQSYFYGFLGAVSGYETITGLTPNTEYEICFIAEYEEGEVTSDVLPVTTEYIDGTVNLGLPSGILWATSNLGSGTGSYYAWGETETKSRCLWSNYKWCKGTEKTLTKYVFDSSYGYDGKTDNIGTLLLEDDAAHVRLGGKWRMPTSNDANELISNCSVTYTTENNVTGFKLTSRRNGKSIFFRANGIKGDELYNDDFAAFFWTSSLYTDRSDSAYLLQIDVSQDDFTKTEKFITTETRNLGQCIRPVYDRNL